MGRERLRSFGQPGPRLCACTMARRWHIRTSGDEGAWYDAQGLGVSGLPDPCHFPLAPPSQRFQNAAKILSQPTNNLAWFISSCADVEVGMWGIPCSAWKHEPNNLCWHRVWGPPRRTKTMTRAKTKMERSPGRRPRPSPAPLPLASICLTMWNVWKRHMFQIVCRARCESILHILEPLYIKLMEADLCREGEGERETEIIFYLEIKIFKGNCTPKSNSLILQAFFGRFRWWRYEIKVRTGKTKRRPKWPKKRTWVTTMRPVLRHWCWRQA